MGVPPPPPGLPQPRAADSFVPEEPGLPPPRAGDSFVPPPSSSVHLVDYYDIAEKREDRATSLSGDYFKAGVRTDRATSLSGEGSAHYF